MIEKINFIATIYCLGVSASVLSVTLVHISRSSPISWLIINYL